MRRVKSYTRKYPRTLSGSVCAEGFGVAAAAGDAVGTGLDGSVCAPTGAMVSTEIHVNAIAVRAMRIRIVFVGTTARITKLHLTTP